jgi:hypothetical protein
MMLRSAGLLLTLLTGSALAQPVTPIEMTIAFDESAADVTTGVVPGHITITNTSSQRVESVGLTLHVLDAGLVTVNSPGFITCPGNGTGYLQCVHGEVPPHGSVEVEAKFRFPERAGRSRVRAYADYSFMLGMRTYGDLEETSLTLWREFLVTSPEDSGPGTLRAAIEAVNAEPVCTVLPCRIDFAIPSAFAWSTIQPRTAFPAITAGDLLIDGTTQPDTNPHGPDVALIGTTLGSGNGLDIRASAAAATPRLAVRGLAIGGFPDSGIFYLPTREAHSAFTIERNYIGTDATGTHAVANGARGITIGEGAVNGSFIRDNVISGNFRSGIFLVTQPHGFLTGPSLRITGNRIGLAAATAAPIPNGASGIFVGPQATEVLIEDNVIAHNGHFGIGVATGASYTRINRNHIYGHPLQAIDLGLDGATPPIVPVRLASATYDAGTNSTIVEVEGPGRIIGDQWYEYTFYANESVDASGHAEAEEYLGTARADVTTGHATLRFAGDLRGKYVNAVPTRVYYAFAAPIFTTEEPLRAIRVE